MRNADLRTMLFQSAFRIPQSKMGSPALEQRGTSSKLEVCGHPFEGIAELFSGLFCVAASRLNSPRLLNRAYTLTRALLSSS
jgi:hypothetical protein